MLQTVKKSLNLLNKIYYSGLILYPRVSNNFERKPSFELFPHPSLSIIDGFNFPLKETKYIINKKTSLLFLSLMKLLKPSGIEKVSMKIDSYFDENLDFINENKKNELMKCQEILEKFLEKKNLTEKDILMLSNSFYSNENKKTIEDTFKIFHINNILIYSIEKKRKTLINKKNTLYKEINNIDEKNKFESINELIQFNLDVNMKGKENEIIIR